MCVCVYVCIFRGALWNPGDLETLDGIPVSSRRDMIKRKQGLCLKYPVHTTRGSQRLTSCYTAKCTIVMIPLTLCCVSEMNYHCYCSKHKNVSLITSLSSAAMLSCPKRWRTQSLTATRRWLPCLNTSQHRTRRGSWKIEFLANFRFWSKMY